MTPREKTHQVTAGNVKRGRRRQALGVQSMTNTRQRRDISATIAQIRRLV